MIFSNELIFIIGNKLSASLDVRTYGDRYFMTSLPNPLSARREGSRRINFLLEIDLITR